MVAKFPQNDDTLSDEIYVKKQKCKAVYERLSMESSERSSSSGLRSDIWKAIGEKDADALLKYLSTEEGSKYVNMTNNRGESPLSTAISSSTLDVVEVLISKGANPRIRNTTSGTTLHVAIEAASLPILSLLLSHNPLLHVRDASGMRTTPQPI